VELIIVRHGLPVRVQRESGAADPELATEGHDQARRLARYLSSEEIHAIYASPLTRAQQTAAPLAELLGTKPEIIDAIAEFDRHASEYVPLEELKAANDPRWHALMAGEWEDHGESPDEFRNRVVNAFEEIVDRHRSQRVVAVCHGGVINQYLAHILGISTTVGFFYPAYTSIHRVSASRGGVRSVMTLNEVAHLRLPY
jgi:2,3-bisphosphoglycerate-dependent phosphoglycerate mutase